MTEFDGIEEVDLSLVDWKATAGNMQVEIDRLNHEVGELLVELAIERQGKRDPLPSDEKVNPFPGQGVAMADLEPEYNGLSVMHGVGLDKANIVTSRCEDFPQLHKPVLDIDVPVKVVPSSTEGHFHLFIDKALSWDDYLDLLEELARAGILEPGYVNASEERGFTAVRLPWVKKPAEKVTSESETAAILADPFAMDAIAEAQSEDAA